MTYFWTPVLVLVLAAASPANGCTHHPDQCNDLAEDCCEAWMTCRVGYFPVETGSCAWGLATEYKCCSEEEAVGSLIGIIVGASVGGGICCCICCAIVYFVSKNNEKKR